MNTLRYILFGLVLIAVTLLTHLPLIPVGMVFHDADLAVSLLAAEFFKSHPWEAFYFQQPYGGSFFSLIRSYYVSLFTNPDHFYFAHMSFSYLVQSSAWTLASFWMLLQFFSLPIAFLTALIPAVGLQSMIQHWGDDFYSLFLISASITLGLQNPLKSPRRALGFGLLSGFNFYNFRGSLLYFIGAVASPDILNKFGDYLKTKYQKIKPLRYFILFLILSYLFLDFFGSNLGSFLGRTIKIDAEGQLSLLVATVIVAYVFYLKKIKFKPSALHLVLLIGLSIGFLPEILFSKHSGVNLANWQTSGLKMALGTLIDRAPLSIKEITLGASQLIFQKNISQLFPILFYFFAAFTLIRTGLRNKTYWPVMFTFILAWLAFFRIHMNGAGQYRYLIPTLPPLIIGAGLAIESALKHKKPIFLLLLIGTFYNQLSNRSMLIDRYQIEKFTEKQYHVVDHFKKMGVNVVISDEYFEGNQYTFLAQHKPYFVTTQREWGPYEGFRLADSEKEIGILLTKNTRDVKDGDVITLRRRSFKVTELTAFESLRFLKGILQKN